MKSSLMATMAILFINHSGLLGMKLKNDPFMGIINPDMDGLVSPIGNTNEVTLYADVSLPITDPLDDSIYPPINFAAPFIPHTLDGIDDILKNPAISASSDATEGDHDTGMIGFTDDDFLLSLQSESSAQPPRVLIPRRCSEKIAAADVISKEEAKRLVFKKIESNAKTTTPSLEKTLQDQVKFRYLPLRTTLRLLYAQGLRLILPSQNFKPVGPYWTERIYRNNQPINFKTAINLTNQMNAANDPNKVSSNFLRFSALHIAVLYQFLSLSTGQKAAYSYCNDLLLYACMYPIGKNQKNRDKKLQELIERPETSQWICGLKYLCMPSHPVEFADSIKSNYLNSYAMLNYNATQAFFGKICQTRLDYHNNIKTLIMIAVQFYKPKFKAALTA